MRVLIIDQECLGLDFAIRCGDAGHEVRWFMDSPKPIKDGQGFTQFKIVSDWRGSMAWAKDGLIMCTGNCKYMADLDRFRDLGFKVFAPTKASAALEIDRALGMKAMQDVGIEVPPYTMFDSLQSAEAFARKSDRGWVFKTMGDEGDKSLSYVASDPADLVGWLRGKIKKGLRLKGPCMLQEKIDMVAEVGVSGWFGPDGFLPDKWQICFEHKKLMAGENGPNTGEQGTVCQYEEDDKLAAQMLVPMVGALRKAGHRGDFAIGCGIDTAGRAWPFEFTARCGWPAFYIQMASHRGDPAQWMRDLLDGKDTLKVSYDVALGVVCAQPNYPYNASTPEMVEGNPIAGLEEAGENAHLASVMLGSGPVMSAGKVVEKKIPMTTGEYVLCATGLGKTIDLARKKVYRTVHAIKFPNKMFRNDIGDKVQKALPMLHKHNYAMEMN